MEVLIRYANPPALIIRRLKESSLTKHDDNLNDVRTLLNI